MSSQELLPDGGIKPQIGIVDYGGQYANLIRKRILSLGVNAVLLSHDISQQEVDAMGLRGIIGSGSPHSVRNGGHLNKVEGYPYLGICYGMQADAVLHAGEVSEESRREDGDSQVILSGGDPLFEGIGLEQRVWMSHGDTVTKIPEGYISTAETPEGLIAAIANYAKKRFDVQFHPEVNDTPCGNQILSNFVFRICRCEKNYNLADRIAAKKAYIRGKVGDKKVLILLSGGTDSTLAARLCLEVLEPERVYGIHIDNGFMRLNESEEVIHMYGQMGFHPGNLELVKAGERFYRAATSIRKGESSRETLPLIETVHPEEKRKIIGDQFIREARKAMTAFGIDPKEDYLVQGSLFTDLIESGSKVASQGGQADVIKSHHNDTALAREFRQTGHLLEPNMFDYKDDIRKQAAAAGLPIKVAKRRPFPGPGLAIRIICADEPFFTDDYDGLHSRVESAVKELSGSSMLGHVVPIRTVGVQGDERSYDYLALLEGKNLPLWDRATWEKAAMIATELPKIAKADRAKGTHGINRVAYLIGPDYTYQNLVRTIIPTKLTPDNIRRCQLMHHIGDSLLDFYDPDYTVAQMPFVLFPSSIGGNRTRSAAIRGIKTHDFMTGKAVIPVIDIPWAFFEKVRDAFLTIDGIGAVVVDISSKPPATTCWE